MSDQSIIITIEQAPEQVITDATALLTVLNKGDKGDDGVAPHIGIDGNWYIGLTDTGILAEGTNGANGSDATVNATNVETVLDAASADTIADADTVNFNKSSVLKKITWANIKATLKTYFDGLYATSAEITIIKQLTAAEYAALTPKVSTTLYIIVG